MKYDNVYSSSISKDVIEIRAAHCNEENLKKEIITDEDVENRKEIFIATSDYRVFLNFVLDIGLQLQQNGIDVGLNLEETNNDKDEEKQ